MNIKNNKGIVGTDISISLIILMLFVAIVTTIFYQIGMTNLETTRHSVATDCVVNILETIQLIPYDDFLNTDLNEDWCTSKGIKIPDGYTVEIQKNSDQEKDNLMQEVKVTVSYRIKDQNKSVSINTLKIRQ